MSAPGKAAVYVSARIPQTSIDLGKWCNCNQEVVGVLTCPVKTPVILISFYARPRRTRVNLGWIRHLRSTYPGVPILVGGDFNAPHREWGYQYNTRRGDQVRNTMVDAAFTLLNQPGVSTCIASTTARTHAPDLTWWIGPGVPQWRAEPDTWGSDHMPIKIGLHSACLKKIRRRVTVTHWDKLREASATMIPTDPTELLPALQQLLRDSIITTTVDEDQPQPDLTLLQLWAKRRQADVAASRNPTTPGGRSGVNHLAAEARRHEKRLSRQRWYEWCDSLGTGTGNKALWRTYHSMEQGGKQPDPAACVRLALQTTPKDFATYAARTFFPKYDQTSPIQCPDIDEPDSTSQADISSPFNMAELIAAIETAKKRTTPVTMVSLLRCSKT